MDTLENFKHLELYFPSFRKVETIIEITGEADWNHRLHPYFPIPVGLLTILKNEKSSKKNALPPKW